MGGQNGVKETVEVMRGAGELNRTVFELAKDGFNFGDVAQLATRPALIAALMRAGDGVNKIPGELKELDQADIAELVGVGVEELRGGLQAAGVNVLENEIGVLVEMAPEFMPLMLANIAFVQKVMAKLEAIKAAKAAKAAAAGS